MRIKYLILSIMLSLSATWNVTAQDETLLNFGVLTRFDYQREYIDGSPLRENSGFKGKNLSIYFNGDLTPRLSYFYRQRLNRAHKDESFFDATDFLYLTYKPTDHWYFSAGKQTVSIGGYEYDLAPIDSYFVSEFSNNIDCYQLGASVSFLFNDRNDELVFQFCQSPFRNIAEKEDTYSYNLLWSGAYKWFKPLWSVNMVEYAQGKFMNYIALGNSFTFGNASFFVDLMNRSMPKDPSFFLDFTVVGKFMYDICDHVSVFAKASHDHNKINSSGDPSVMPGTSITRAGGGFEFFPLKQNKDLRIHAVFCKTFGSNGNPNGALVDKQTYANIGLSWRMNLLSFKKKQKV